MQVQINLSTPFEFRAGQPIKPFGFCGDIVLATDPGKTNMAMTVGTPFGTQLAILQFRAPGSAYNTSDYCHDFKDFLSRYFANCNIQYFGIEQAITKRGMGHHHSSMVLTEIRANLIDLAYHLTGDKPLEINNWSWKYAILPDGMRSQSEKGSARFLKDAYRLYGNADVTDAICMYRYIIQKHCGPYVIFPNRVERPLASYQVFIVPLGSKLVGKARRFQYEQALSLADNCAYYTNRTWERGATQVPVEALSLEDIYAHAVGFSPSNIGKDVEVVVVRSGLSVSS